jgi:predicted AAA+ superfamily ATPase
MMYVERLLKLNLLLTKKSIFLFGARATGKTSMIRHQLDDSVPIIDLLRGDVYLRLSSEPWGLEDMILSHQTQTLIVIDEIQRIPALLNEVHRLIETRQWRFLLTGSSARRLRQKGVNLLAGRAWEAHLFPFTYHEIPDFDLPRFLRYGGLPSVWLSDSPEEELYAYVDTYLKEEIRAEAWVRKLMSFSRFLSVAALTSGDMLNFSSVANDTGVPVSTVREYYHILEDTLLGFMVPAWTKSVKRKPISTAKFYLFDLGVCHTLADIRNLDPKSNLFGRAFEQFIACELRAYIQYQRLKLPLSYWRSKNGQEVDFIVGDSLAIEVKASTHILRRHGSGLRALQEEGTITTFIIVSQDPIERVSEEIHHIHWRSFLERLWHGEWI